MAVYTVRQGEGISDVVLNSTGSISLWSDFLDSNFLPTWTPDLYAGEILQVPDSTTANLNNIRALNTYPANNFSVPDIKQQINAIFDLMNPIS